MDMNNNNEMKSNVFSDYGNTNNLNTIPNNSNTLNSQNVQNNMAHQSLNPNEVPNNGTSISMGAVIVKKETSFNQMYKEADKLLYKAKEQGRGRVVIENDKSVDVN